MILCVKALYKEGGSLERHTPMLRQTILLSVGTICNKMINTMRRHNKPIPQLLSAVEEVSAVSHTSYLSSRSFLFLVRISSILF